MAVFGSSSMTGDLKIGATAFFLTMWIGYFLITGVAAITGAAAIPRADLDETLPVLRCRGYNRIGHAIKTSDLIKDCLVFAPADESMEVAHISGESGLRSHAVSDLFLLPSPEILTTLLSNHSLSITVLGRCRTVHIAVNGAPLQSPGLYHSSHGLAGALIPLCHFPSCCLPQSPIRATRVETPRTAYAGPHALHRLQSPSSNGDLLPPPPDTSIGFSISSSTAAAISAATIAAGVIILFRPRHNSSPLDDDASSPDDDAPSPDDNAPQLNENAPQLNENAPQLDDAAPRLEENAPRLDENAPRLDDAAPRLDDVTPRLDENAPRLEDNAPRVDDVTPRVDDVVPRLDDAAPRVEEVAPRRRQQQFNPLDVDMDGFSVILQMILNTLRLHLIFYVRVSNPGDILPVTWERGLADLLYRNYSNRLGMLLLPRDPDYVVMVIEMPDGTTLHIGQVPFYFMNALDYDDRYNVRITPVEDDEEIPPEALIRPGNFPRKNYYRKH